VKVAREKEARSGGDKDGWSGGVPRVGMSRLRWRWMQDPGQLGACG
jgi:hypothetical protein